MDKLKTRLIIWLTACLAISVISFGKLWLKLPEWLSPDGLQSHGVFHWGVLGLCIGWLYLKRKDILSRMPTGGRNSPFMLGGVALLSLSIFLPRSDDSLVFLMLLGWLGIFAMIFSRAAVIPVILLLIYGFSLAFPIFAIRWLGEPSAILVLNTVTAITQVLGLPITNQGQVLHFTSVNGDVISTMVSADCAGYATMGVFVALFALMMLDIRLPLKRAWYVFLFGLVGTWLQNIARIVVSVVTGYYGGLDALETMHANIAYIIFPLWFALFAFIYLRQTGWRSKKKA